VTDNSWVAKPSIRIMTYNVHGCLGMDGRLSPQRIAKVIGNADVDIVAIQELDADRSRSGFHDQAQLIARYLEMECHFHPAWSLQEERYGDAILSRFPLQIRQVGTLPAFRTNREPRGFLWVEVEVSPELRLQVLNTHLSLYPNDRKRQAEYLVDQWIPLATKHGPIILCGDFNATPGSASYRRLQRELQDVQRYSPRHRAEPTWFSSSPMARIDHIFTSSELIVDHVQVIGHRLARVASDHLPLIADLLCP
jgi:endonuclease/exonuclease/phosphatase family metal-dependent hydrolase